MSKEKLLLVGAGGFGRMVAEQAMIEYDCAFVDDGQPVGTDICGIPVVGGLANLPELRKEYGLLVVGIGNNRFRAQVYEKAKALGFGKGVQLRRGNVQFQAIRHDLSLLSFLYQS